MSNQSVKERPINLSGQEVRAVMEGRKTQARRIVKPLRRFPQHNICDPHMAFHPWAVWWHGEETDRFGCLQECPFGKPGDKLRVRESFAFIDNSDFGERSYYEYRADTDGKCLAGDWPDEHKSDPDRPRWRSPIHMPRAASRITLQLNQVRVERLQDISEEDAKAEGGEPWQYGPEQTMTTGERGADSPYRGGFACLWDELNDNVATWKSNPWVWVLQFEIEEVRG